MNTYSSKKIRKIVIIMGIDYIFSKKKKKNTLIFYFSKRKKNQNPNPHNLQWLVDHPTTLGMPRGGPQGVIRVVQSPPRFLVVGSGHPQRPLRG
jgi:hypothetical protein